MRILNRAEYFGILTILLCSYGRSEQEMVTTKSGILKGIKLKHGDAEVYAYLGIPYAVPPIGEMRFRDSIPLKPWKGVYHASTLAYSCVQEPGSLNYEWLLTDSTNLNEDCLYLNIWVPVDDKGNDRKAVMLWIHGGSFNTGSSKLNVYDGKALAIRGNVIVVSINYRLGAFGFLYSGTDDAPGNMGMKDQILAMRWVKDNIEAFGGDSSHITIFGQSAGSISISSHLVSPLTKGLFSRAILQSGTSYQPALTTSFSVGMSKFNKLANVIGCVEENVNATVPPTEIIACLRNLDASFIAVAERKHMVGPMSFSFLPIHGDDYLPVHPIKEFNAGNIYEVDILVGNVPDEGSLFLLYVNPGLLQVDRPVLTKEQAAKYIEAAFQAISNPPTSVIIDFYLKNVSPSDRKLILKKTYDSIGDWLLYCPVVFLSDSFSAHKMKAYYYIFDYRPRVSSIREWLEKNHLEEIPFVFGNELQYYSSCSPEDLEFSHRIMDTWITFAKTGKATFEGLSGEWPIYSKEKPVAVDLNPYNVKILNPYKEECKFWKQYY